MLQHLELGLLLGRVRPQENHLKEEHLGSESFNTCY